MGIVFIILALWVLFQTTQIPEKLVSNEPGPKLFPYISAIGMIVMAVLSMIFDGKKEADDNKHGAAPYLDAAGWKRLALIMVECIVFCAAMNVIGFWITSMIGMMVFIMTLKVDKKINIVFAIVFLSLIHILRKSRNGIDGKQRLPAPPATGGTGPNVGSIPKGFGGRI